MTTVLARYLSSCRRFRSMALRERIAAIAFSICHFGAVGKLGQSLPTNVTQHQPRPAT